MDTTTTPSSNMSGIAPAVIGAVSSVGDSILGALTAKANMGRQTRLNMKLAKYNNSMNVANWQMQNQYNAPSAQMQRYRDAGLNPNLIYGQGTPGNAGSLPNYHTDPIDASLPAPIHLGKTLGAYQDTAIKKVQTDNLKSQLVAQGIKNSRDALSLDVEKLFKEEMTQIKVQRQKILMELDGYKQSQALADLEKRQALLNQEYEAARAGFAVQARQLEKFNLDIALAEQQKLLNQSLIDLRKSQQDLNTWGIPWKQLQIAKGWREFGWMPFNNLVRGIGTVVGAGTGIGRAVTGAKVANQTFQRWSKTGKQPWQK